MASSRQDNSVALIALIAAGGAIVAVTALWVYRDEPMVQTVIKRVVPAALQPAEPLPLPPTDLTPLPPDTTRAARPRVPAADAGVPATVATPVDPPAVTAAAAPTAIATAATPKVTPPVGPVVVYSGGDEGVMAPEAIRAQLGTHRLAMTPGQVVKFEFVVDTNGYVESARIVPDATNSLGDTMLSTVALQIIRGWRFRPAVKDGVPVKFRQQMSFTGAGEKIPARE